MSDDDDDEPKPYVPKISTKKPPEYHVKKAAAQNRRRHADRPRQARRIAEFRTELKQLGIHTPRRHVTKANVDAIKAIKAHLRETWQAYWDKINDCSKLTPKQVEFARQFAKNGRTNKTAAMKRAGYDSAHPDVLLGLAKKNLAIPGFNDLITAFELEEKARMKLTVEDVVKWFNDIATAAMSTGDFTNANRAMENLAKYLGMFIEKKEIVHRTVHSKEELDARIQELTSVLREVEPEIERRLRIN